MPKCEYCGKEVLLPFKCNFCGKYFCVEHRLPENHNCPNMPKRLPLGPASHPAKDPYALTRPRKKKKRKKKEIIISEGPYHFVKTTIPQEPKKTKRKLPIGKMVAFSLIILVLGVILWNAPVMIAIFEKIIESQSPQAYEHEELVNYALSLINSDRMKNGLSKVSLSSIDCAQKHAENMLKYHYFSHWDINGYKPYMRYTLAGGKGAVAENIAWYYSTEPIDPKEAIEELEWQMVYNDSIWDWGHRKNIMNPFHNKVSIGIAYDDHNLYLVQDFENDYIEWITLHVNQNEEVVMSGTLVGPQVTICSICIFYDPQPKNLTPSQLSKSPYDGAYDMGTFIGMVVPPGYQSTEGITIVAQTWIQTGKTFQIKFSLSPAFKLHKEGVYTLYIQPDPKLIEDYLTSYSIWYNDEVLARTSFIFRELPPAFATHTRES